MSDLSRREALGLVFGAGASLALAGCSSDPASDDTASSAPISTPSSGNTPDLEATVRDLSLSLWAEPATAEIIQGVTTKVYSFGAEVTDGEPASVTPGASYLGPTLHLRQGQRVRVSFENQLPQEGFTDPSRRDGRDRSRLHRPLRGQNLCGRWRQGPPTSHTQNTRPTSQLRAVPPESGGVGRPTAQQPLDGEGFARPKGGVMTDPMWALEVSCECGDSLKGAWSEVESDECRETPDCPVIDAADPKEG